LADLPAGEGQVSKDRWPQSVGSRLVTSCKDCCGVATKNFPIKPALLKKLKASAPAAKKARRATKRR